MQKNSAELLFSLLTCVLCVCVRACVLFSVSEGLLWFPHDELKNNVTELKTWYLNKDGQNNALYYSNIYLLHEHIVSMI